MKNFAKMSYDELIQERIENLKSPKEVDNFLSALWEEFANVPVDEDSDNIEDSFYIWKIGTGKLDIWHWFDDNHSLGLAVGLMGLE